MAKRLWDKGGSLDAAVQAFTVGDDPIVDLDLVPWDALASGAHARMLHAIGVLSEDELTRLLSALQGIIDSHRKGAFSIPFELEDCHTAIENALVQSAGEAGKKIHTGRSRNDQVLVAMRLYVRNAVSELLLTVDELISVLLKRAKDDLDTPMPGYTHFQRAMPTSYGVWFHATAEQLLVAAQEGAALLEALNCNPLGVASGFGVPLPLDRKMTADLLGFASVQRNPIAVINSRGLFELRCLRWCTNVLAAVEKFASDVVLFCSEEFGLLSLPREFTTGSSIMPQKRNPDVAELMRGKVAIVRAAAQELEWVSAKLPSHYHRDHQLTKAPLRRGIDTTFELLRISIAVAKAVHICPERAAAAMGPELFATYEAYRLVNSGMSFREAYVQAAATYEQGKLDLAALRSELQTVLTRASAEIAACEDERNSLAKALADTSKGYNEALAKVLTPNAERE